MTDLPYPEGYSSYEAWIEAHAGDSPPEPRWPDVPLTQEQADRLDTLEVGPSDWPQERPPPFAADDEDKTDPKERAMTGRLVWIDDEAFNALCASGQRKWIVDAWDAAPADPAEAIVKAARAHEYPGGQPGPVGGRGRYSQANAILRALGAPDE